MVVDPQELVDVRDFVHVRVLSVEEVSVRFPDEFEHLDARSQNVDVVGDVERESRVVPLLPEVTIHRKHLQDAKTFPPRNRH